MKFWDSSALLSLLVAQAGQEAVRAVLDEDREMALWWGTHIELASGLCRLHRESLIDDGTFSRLLKVVVKIMDDADEVQPTEQIRQASIRILRVHRLRAADSLQLAAALAWTENSPSGAGFVCLDKRLCEAADEEGFELFPK